MTPPQRGFVERWVIAIVLAFLVVPAVVIAVTVAVKLWAVTVLFALLVVFLFYVRWRRSNRATGVGTTEGS
jgi:hypothetical protein